MKKKYIQVNEKELYTLQNHAVLNMRTGKWEPASPELYSPSIKEWFTHNILGQHFTFGQPYCVVCGCAEDLSTKPHKAE